MQLAANHLCVCLFVCVCVLWRRHLCVFILTLTKRPKKKCIHVCIHIWDICSTILRKIDPFLMDKWLSMETNDQYTFIPLWIALVLLYGCVSSFSIRICMHTHMKMPCTHGLQSVQLNFLSAIKKTIFESKGEEKEEEDGKMHTPRSIYKCE